MSDNPTIEASHQKLRFHWQEMTREIKHLEEENNSKLSPVDAEMRERMA